MSDNKNMFVLNRDYILATKQGYIVKFTKDEPTYVPPSIQQQAAYIGAVRADGESLDIQESETIAEPATPAERNPLIIAAIEELVAKNDADDFTAAGAPSIKAVSKITSFKISSKELQACWKEYHERQNEGK